MNIEEAKNLIHHEYESDEGLDLLFRMSADIEEERITTFLKALKCIEEYYTDKSVMEKKMVYQLFSMHQTLQASMRHWKVSRPKGLDKDTCFEIFTSIRNVFSS